MDKTLLGRAPVIALADIEQFLQSAEHLKALALQLHALRCRDSRRQASLAQQINTFTEHCGALARVSPRLGDLWAQTQAELHTITPGIVPAPLAGGMSPATGMFPAGCGTSPAGRKPAGGLCPAGETRPAGGVPPAGAVPPAGGVPPARGAAPVRSKACSTGSNAHASNGKVE